MGFELKAQILPGKGSGLSFWIRAQPIRQYEFSTRVQRACMYVFIYITYNKYI